MFPGVYNGTDEGVSVMYAPRRPLKIGVPFFGEAVNVRSKR